MNNRKILAAVRNPAKRTIAKVEIIEDYHGATTLYDLTSVEAMALLGLYKATISCSPVAVNLFSAAFSKIGDISTEDFLGSMSEIVKASFSASFSYDSTLDSYLAQYRKDLPHIEEKAKNSIQSVDFSRLSVVEQQKKLRRIDDFAHKQRVRTNSEIERLEGLRSKYNDRLYCQKFCLKVLEKVQVNSPEEASALSLLFIGTLYLDAAMKSSILAVINNKLYKSCPLVLKFKGLDSFLELIQTLSDNNILDAEIAEKQLSRYFDGQIDLKSMPVIIDMLRRIEVAVFFDALSAAISRVLDEKMGVVSIELITTLLHLKISNSLRKQLYAELKIRLADDEVNYSSQQLVMLFTYGIPKELYQLLFDDIQRQIEPASHENRRSFAEFLLNTDNHYSILSNEVLIYVSNFINDMDMLDAEAARNICVKYDRKDCISQEQLIEMLQETDLPNEIRKISFDQAIQFALTYEELLAVSEIGFEKGFLNETNLDSMLLASFRGHLESKHVKVICAYFANERMWPLQELFIKYKLKLDDQIGSRYNRRDSKMHWRYLMKNKLTELFDQDHEVMKLARK
jgi:hypothetical protein